MTNLEVCTDLRARNSEKKLYGNGPGEIKQQTFSALLLATERGFSKPSTVHKFFSRFGYEGSYDNWSKTVAQ